MAYRANAGLLELWKLKNVKLCTSPYALEEARINLSDEVSRERLAGLSIALELFDAALQDLPHGVSLPEKDAPIMLAAIEARASHLLTEDLRHFGAYFSKKISGITIITPADYLKGHSAKLKIW